LYRRLSLFNSRVYLRNERLIQDMREQVMGELFPSQGVLKFLNLCNE